MSIVIGRIKEIYQLVNLLGRRVLALQQFTQHPSYFFWLVFTLQFLFHLFHKTNKSTERNFHL